MARDVPYVQFNFLVNLDGMQMGFQEISGMGMEVTPVDYRTGDSKENSVRKVMGLNKSSDITLKRGIAGTLDLYNWLDQIRNGKFQQGYKDGTITLLSEDREPIMTWTLSRARIIKYTCGPLNAKGTDVAMEEMVLAHERLTMALGRG